MQDVVPRSVVNHTTQLCIRNGHIQLDDALLDALGGNGAWLEATIVEGTVVLKESVLSDATIAAVRAMPLDTDEA